ncbi:hypothetical protein BT63DRAFT_416499 [Microthyrium microscopicum]|uniref:AhpC/TSA antioxidant enzyme-domain-containing protein n=1 Tax=Microthyrium microscopicum TaxID=703497 RepID=A0A6A6U4M1_9PEZI|nr:hypothetical protein BT63DRAFT_416499 [Microthyrium microscopicum]
MPLLVRSRTSSKVSKADISWPVESRRQRHDIHIAHHDIPLSPPVRPNRPSMDFSRTPSSCSSTDSTGQRRRSLTSSFRLHTQRTSECSESTCSGPEMNLVSPDRLPSDEELKIAGAIPIFDSNGNSRPFKSLYEGPTSIGEQQLVVFVRHFFCGACQAYLKALSEAVSLQTYFTLPTPTSITIIGLGDPALIPLYRSATRTPFPIYTDPTRRLHRMLGMGWSLNIGSRPNYFRGTNEVKWVIGQIRDMRKVEENIRLKGGAWWWVGGEYLIRDGKVTWCHRMRNYRDHVEMNVIKKLLQIA